MADPGSRRRREGNTLTFVHRDTGFGMSRYTYIVGEGEYGLRIENFADGTTWSTFLEGTYERTDPAGPADRSA